MWTWTLWDCTWQVLHDNHACLIFMEFRDYRSSWSHIHTWDYGVLHAEKICPRGLHILPQRIQLVEYEDSMSGSKGVIACQCINSHLYQGRWGPPKHKISWSSKHHQAKTNIIRTLGLKDNWKSHPNEENRDLYSTLDIF